jgi:hypothetical protein
MRVLFGGTKTGDELALVVRDVEDIGAVERYDNFAVTKWLGASPECGHLGDRRAPSPRLRRPVIGPWSYLTGGQSSPIL